MRQILRITQRLEYRLSICGRWKIGDDCHLLGVGFDCVLPPGCFFLHVEVQLALLPVVVLYQH